LAKLSKFFKNLAKFQLVKEYHDFDQNAHILLYNRGLAGFVL